VREREVSILVRRAGEVLVLRRSQAGGGYWHVVAGAVEAGESDAEAAARELLEETGLTGRLIDLERSTLYPSPHGDVTVVYFSGEAPAGWEPLLNEEHDEYRWCGLDEACSLLHWPEVGEVLRAS
jgi:8-oxo-dGTP pyrophosphatase MutT (NUDIX family)